MKTQLQLINTIIIVSLIRTALFWVITQRVVVIPYRRFRTTYLVPSSRVKNLKLFGFLTLEDGTNRLS